MSKNKMKWSYEGDTGPEYWHKLCPGCAPCGNGKSQSPVDISETVKSGKGNLVFENKAIPFAKYDNGHNIEFRPVGGLSINLDGNTFFLDHFHFHSPSEHTRDGNSFDMELHLVHKDALENIAVVGVLFRRGKHNPVIQSLWNLVSNQESTDGPKLLGLDMMKLLPANKSYYFLEGSLTTPPCSEGVKWVAMITPLEVSDAQVEFFLSLTGPNARPVQPLNGRTIYEFEYQWS